jgi:hypothetical protein
MEVTGRFKWLHSTTDYSKGNTFCQALSACVLLVALPLYLPHLADGMTVCNTAHMAERTYYPARQTPSRAALSELAVPVGEAAIQRTLTLANDALLGCFPEHLRTATLSDRFITLARIHPVPQQELATRQHTDKPADRIASFTLLLAAGAPRQNAEELIYSVRPGSTAYANLFLDQPELFFDEQFYQLFFSVERGEREYAMCILGKAVIDSNLAAAPTIRTLPQDPWQEVLRGVVEQRLLLSFRRLLEEAGTYDGNCFTTLAANIRSLLGRYEISTPPRPCEEETLRLINNMLNAFFGDDQVVEAVEWEPQPQSRLVAHGAKVLFLLPGQVLPVFEFGTGMTFDHETRLVFARQAVLAFYAKLQQHHSAVVAQQERQVFSLLTPMPQAYLEMGVTRPSILERYLCSDIPDWYLENMPQPGQGSPANGSTTLSYPA